MVWCKFLSFRMELLGVYIILHAYCFSVYIKGIGHIPNIFMSSHKYLYIQSFDATGKLKNKYSVLFGKKLRILQKYNKNNWAKHPSE